MTLGIKYYSTKTLREKNWETNVIQNSTIIYSALSEISAKRKLKNFIEALHFYQIVRLFFREALVPKLRYVKEKREFLFRNFRQ